MASSTESRAVIYCQGAFGTTTGKTAHGLVRRSRRYKVIAILDSTHADADAGLVLDGRANGIPIVADLQSTIHTAKQIDQPITHFVIGLAPDGGRLADNDREVVKQAITAGLHVDSGLHDFLTDDPELMQLAAKCHVQLRDVRKPPKRDRLHFYSGKINEVQSLKVAVLGTDSAVGKRTTAWSIVDGLNAIGVATELVGTGQTAWLQGARYGITLDSLVNDFIAGELEHAVWSAWNEMKCRAIVIEGQGSLMHPAYPGGFEILAACRPHIVVMQHAPARKEYDGFPGFPIAPLEKQIRAVELVSNAKVIGVTINHEGIARDEIDAECRRIAEQTGLPTCDVLIHGTEKIVNAILEPMQPSR